MRRCDACGTRLSPDATRCWLCHAPAPEDNQRRQVEGWETSTPRDHVWSGPLARIGSHLDADPVPAHVYSRLRSGPLTLGPAGRVAMTILVVLCALLFYALYPSPITFVWIAPIVLGGGVLLRRVWRQGRVA